MPSPRLPRTHRRGYQAPALPVVGMVVVVALLLPARAPAAEGLPTAKTSELKAALKPDGKPRLVHFWATWCAPCVAEWPTLAPALRELARRPLDVVTIALDKPSRAEAAAQLLAENGAPGLALLAPPPRVFPVVRLVDPDFDGALPTTLLLDEKGRLVHVQRGTTRLPLLTQALDRLPAPVRR